MSTNESTIPESELLHKSDEASGDRALGFVVLWCPTQLDRVGTWLPVSKGTWILGRGPAQATDEHPRLPLLRQRPGGNVTVSPFESAALSRVQLVVDRTGPHDLRVHNSGRCPLQVNGESTQSAVVRQGDVIQVGEQLLFICVERPIRMPRYAGNVGAFGAPDADGIVGESEAAWQLRGRIAFVGPLAGHALLFGQSGVGKELVANAVHRVSGRRPLVSRNASTIPDTLADAELFGNAEGYPNAGMRERKGLIGSAHGGTLFLDEFGELSMALQTHLLRVLDAGEYQRLGDATVRHSDFRLLAATNRPASALRQDVLARFELTIEIPDLLARREDIPLIVLALLEGMAVDEPFIRERFFSSNGSARVSFDSIRRLVMAPPPANVRGLRHALWRAVEFSTGDVIGLPPEDGEGSSADDESVDARRLRKALEASGGSIEGARRELGLSSRFVLIRLMKKHGVTIRKSPTSSH